MPLGVPETIALLDRLIGHLRDNGDAVVAAVGRVVEAMDEGWHFDVGRSAGARSIKDEARDLGISESDLVALVGLVRAGKL